MNSFQFFGRILSLFFLLIASLPAFSQYKFDSKDFKKLYEKCQKAYDDYNYDVLLSAEEELVGFAQPTQDTLTALVYSWLAESHAVQGDPLKAYQYYQDEFALRQKIQPKEAYDYGSIVYNLASFAMDMGNYQESERLFLELVNEDKKKYGTKSEEYAQTVKNLAELYKNTGRYKDAENTLRRLMREAGEKNPQYPSIVTNLAMLYTTTGEFSKSEKTFTRALGLIENGVGSASADYVVALANLSFLYQSAGRYSDAEQTLTDAVAILDRLQGENTEVRSLVVNYMGIVKRRLGLYDDAVRYLQESLALDAELFGEDSPNYAFSLDALGLAYTYQGKHAEAIATFQKALEIIAALMGEESFDYSFTQANLALAYINDGQLDVALNTMTNVLKTDQKVLGEDHPDYANSVHDMGNLYFKRQNLAEAERYFAESLRIRIKAIGATHPKYAETTNKLATLKWAQRDTKAAEALYKETFANFFGQINTFFPILSEDEKSTFYYTKLRKAFEEFNSFAVEQNKENPALTGDMYNFQLATKGLILYATNKVRESILNSGDSTLINKFGDWISQKEQIARLYSASDEEIETRNRKIDSLTQLANTLEKELSTASAAFANTFVQKDYTWQNVRDQLKPGEAAVEIVRFREFKPDSSGFFTDEVYYAALIVRHDTQTQPDIVIIRNGNNMENRYLANYRNAIRYKIEEDHSYGLFWKPIANKLTGVKKVYFSPDGVYNQISIYSLRNPATERYTLDEIAIQIVTNTKDLIDSPAGSSPALKDGKAMLIGYPNYHKGSFEEMIAQTTTTGDMASAADVRGTRGTRGSAPAEENTRGGVSRGLPRGIRGNLNRYINSNDLLALLPGTKVEVEKISSLYASANQNSDIVLGDSAVESSIKEVKSPKTLHIATHGFFLENPNADEAVDTKYVQNPLLRSGLIFAGANSYLASGEISNNTGNEDGILTAYEAMNLSLEGTDLVVLSACETGLGTVQNGEGVYGLQRAFKIAGAKSMIMSMWTVDDDATQELMTTFYQTWLKTGDKHGSFITAQRELKKKYPEPYYWGAFIMIGD